MSSAVIRRYCNEIGIPRCALSASSGGHAARPDNTRTVALPPPPRCYRAALFSQGIWTHTFKHLPAPKLLRLPQVQVALLPISYREKYGRLPLVGTLATVLPQTSAKSRSSLQHPALRTHKTSGEKSPLALFACDFRLSLIHI